jgi:alpha-L-fucosidase
MVVISNLKWYMFLVVATIVGACSSQGKDKQPANSSEYEANWESLSRHNEAPQWFQDAKFGIYFHWGVYTVPAYKTEWYPRWMHFPGHDINRHHIKTYGALYEFGYHDFVPMFKAEKFDASQWADLFEEAGAKFAGPVAEHHDGFSMWASKQTPWNAKDMGPKRDVTGELAKAIRAKGLKFITTFHHARNLQRYADDPKAEINGGDASNPFRRFNLSHYPLIPGTAPNSNDPLLCQLYGKMPEALWLDQMWFGKLKEVIDNYQPDIIWFDSWLDQIPESYRLKFCAYYLNSAKKWDKEVVIVRKQMDLPLECSVDDLERSRKNKIEQKVWMTDEAISSSSWSYIEGLEIKKSRDLIHVLADIVSKNGVLLFNVSPKSDGTIPENQREVLLQMGDWLKQYGEAIYGTRSWYTFGEGPTKEPEGHFRNREAFQKIKYSDRDFRFTQKGNNVYVIQLGAAIPGTDVTLDSFSADYKVKKVVALANQKEVKWKQNETGLTIEIPREQNEMAPVYKVVL